MKIKLNRIILFVNNVDKLKNFYIEYLNLELVEEIASEWVLLKAGDCEIGLHRVGIEYRVPENEEFRVDTNAKLVFQIDEDIVKIRESLLKKGVNLRELKTFDGFDFWLCDGEDPEGNVFQLQQPKKLKKN